jgi:hypothetical protein
MESTPPSPYTLALLALLLAPSLWLGWRARIPILRAARLLWALARARRDGFGRLRPGRVPLLGRVVPIDPVVSPETGRRGVYLAYAADRWGSSTVIGTLAGQWIPTEHREEAAPFELTDGRDALLVDPSGASFLVPEGRPRQIEQPDGRLVRYTESMLEEQQQVLVVGRVRQVGGFDPSATYRGHTYRLVLAARDGDPLFLAAPGGLAPRLLGTLTLGLLAQVPAAVLGVMFLAAAWRYLGL